MGAEDRVMFVYCEVVQKIKNSSNHLRVFKKFIEQSERLEVIA
jgi:hypothetical protein